MLCKVKKFVVHMYLQHWRSPIGVPGCSALPQTPSGNPTLTAVA